MNLNNFEIAKIFNEIGKNEGVYLAGGCFFSIANMALVRDWDIWFCNEEARNAWIQWFDENAVIVANTEVRDIFEAQGADNLTTEVGSYHAKTYIYNEEKYQLIVDKIFKSVEDLIDFFDFTICKIAWHPDHFYADPRAVEHQNHKLLEVDIDYNVKPDNVTRIGKYLERGTLIGPILWKKLKEFKYRG